MGEPDEPPLQDHIHSSADPPASEGISAGPPPPLRGPDNNTNSNDANNNVDAITSTSVRPRLALTATVSASGLPHGLPGTKRPATQPFPIYEEKPYNNGSYNVSTPDSAITKEESADTATAPTVTTDDGSGASSITPTVKPGWPARIKAGSKRFVNHTKDALLYSWINVLLIFVPIGIGINYAPLPHDTKPTIVFAMNAVAIIPLAGLLSHATESVARRMGDTWASLLNVTFGNAVELIIFILALMKNQIAIVQASILGSILANLLLILGMAFALGGLRFREQIYNNTVTQMSAVLLALSVVSLLLPTAFHATFNNDQLADSQTLIISRGTSVILLFIYILYLVFQLKSHAYMYESTPQQIIDEESHPGVLADMMNGSSDSSSSDSDSDSDSSIGSHTTATKRIRRAFRHRRRRKSNASSMASSMVTSPVEDSAFSPTESYFERFTHFRRGTNLSAAHSGDEADTDGEHEGRRNRNHEVDDEKEGTVSAAASIKKRFRRKHHKKHLKRSRKAQAEIQATLAGVAAKADSKEALERKSSDTTEQGNGKARTPSPHLTFAEEDVEIQKRNQLEPAPSRRPFTLTRASFRPPVLPNPFANTVFSSTQPPAPQPPAVSGPAALSIARGPQLRHTTSLPERMNNNQQVASDSKATPAPAPYNNGFPINQVDAIRKDREDEAEAGEGHEMSRTAAVVLLLISTGLVAFCAELLVDAIPEMIADTNVSQAFIGLIILPIVGNAAEHVTAVTVAIKNKMDLAIGIAVGSSIQIALFITPVIVLIGWIADKDMTLYFNLFETVSLFVTVFVVNFLVLDGRSNYLEGVLLIASYVIIALIAFYYPQTGAESALGGA